MVIYNVHNNTYSVFMEFFKEHAGYPKFKSKHDGHKSYTTNFTNGNISVDFESEKIKLPKLKQLRAKLQRKLAHKEKRGHLGDIVTTREGLLQVVIRIDDRARTGHISFTVQLNLKAGEGLERNLSIEVSGVGHRSRLHDHRIS